VGRIGEVSSVINASYATGNADANNGSFSDVGRLVGSVTLGSSFNDNYGFGTASNGAINGDGAPPMGVTAASGLTAANAGDAWANSASTDWDWDFGTNTQNPVLVVDFNGDGTPTWQEFGSQPRQ